MTAERWKKIETLYHAALEHTPGERDGFLTEACVGDDELRLEIAALLFSDGRAENFIEKPAFEVAAKALAAEPRQSKTPIPSQIGSYQILAPLGRGGMGEVHLALDTRLERKVAIKLLPAEFTSNADRVRRFAREAHAVSALNHPNILTIHEISETENSHFIVTEFVEGETLRQRLKDTTEQATAVLKPAEAVGYAVQITAALDAAHQAGIIHRDIKPENVMIRRDGIVKVLDFGLAKLTELRNADFGLRNEDAPPLLQIAKGNALFPQDNPHSAIHNPQSENSQSTAPGLVLGTPRYMSPEQARGIKVDARTDIFSLGVVLYEMLAGCAPFVGATPSETIAAILRDEPPEISELNHQISPQLARIVRHCLEKKPELRFQSARDLGFALEALSTPSGARLEKAAALPALPVRRGNKRLTWFVAAACLLGLLGLALASFRRAPAASRVTYTSLPPPEKTTYTDMSGAMLSPDGRQMVMVSVTEGVRRLWLYSFDQAGPVLLVGTEGVRYPFWSPKGQSLGFFAQGKLKRIELAGGLLTTLCDAPVGTGGAWSSTGIILFAPEFNGAGLYRIAETGGTATPLTTLDAARFEMGHGHPRFLPDGRHFIFFTQAGQPENRGIRLGSLDDSLLPLQTRFLLRADTKAEYSAAGYLLLLRGRKILAQPFDPARLAVSGEPVPVAEQVYYEAPLRYTDLSVYGDQMLLYRGGGNPNGQLIWYDRQGGQLAAVGPAGEYRSLQLSPDGNQVLLDRNDPQTETSDIWKFDLLRQTSTRLTSNPATDTFPIWSPDGSQAAFVSHREGFWGIYRVGDDEKEELLLKGDQNLLLTSDWSSDGKFIVYRKAHEKTGLDIEILPLHGARQPQTYLATAFEESYGKVSPDGHWLAYQSEDSGHLEIDVQSFPVPGQKVTVSQGGGMLARWRRDGKELYYVAADGKLMAVPVETGARFRAGTPVPLFDLGTFGRRINWYNYDVSRDGQKFLVIRPLDEAPRRPLMVVQNWTELLKK